MSALGRFLLTKDMAALQETAIPHLLEAKLTEPSNPFHWQLCIVGGVGTPWQVSSAVL
jgi:ubiquitin-protein ligase